MRLLLVVLSMLFIGCAGNFIPIDIEKWKQTDHFFGPGWSIVAIAEQGGILKVAYVNPVTSMGLEYDVMMLAENVKTRQYRFISIQGIRHTIERDKIMDFYWYTVPLNAEPAIKKKQKSKI